MPSPIEFHTRIAVTQDMPSIHVLLDEWSNEPGDGHIDDQEITEIVSDVARFTSNDLRNGRVYRIAEDIDGNVLGIMGMCTASNSMGP
jgi:hypothetical protein